MVNARFPAPTGYGFEMVDTPGSSSGCDGAHQSKIYAKSTRTHFSRIFAALISMQILPI
jgi:hypothetical protein